MIGYNTEMGENKLLCNNMEVSNEHDIESEKLDRKPSML